MTKNKVKKIIIAILLTLLISVIGVFLYFFIYSSMYKLECSRINQDVLEKRSIEFNISRKVKKEQIINVLSFSSKENAKDYYDNFLMNKENTKLNDKNIEFYYDDSSNINKSLDEVKKSSSEFGFKCEMVRK